MRTLDIVNEEVFEGGPALWEMKRCGADGVRYRWNATAEFGGVEVNFAGGNERAQFAADMLLKYSARVQDLIRAAGGVVGCSPLVERFAMALEKWKNETLKPLGYENISWNAVEINVHKWGPVSLLPETISLFARTAPAVKRLFEEFCEEFATAEKALPKQPLKANAASDTTSMANSIP